MDLTVICVTAIIFVTFYKVVFLLARRKERMALIDKLSDLPPEMYDATAVRDRINSLTNDGGGLNIDLSNRYTALRWGAVALGAGLGLLTAFFICMGCNRNVRYGLSDSETGIVYFSSLLLFTGLGLIVAFVTELRMRSRQSAND